jgi:adenosylcobinamide-phosphate synthase
LPPGCGHWRANERAARRLTVTALGAAVGIGLDRMLGEPPTVIHPVVGFGRLMKAAERRWYRDARLAGSLHAGAAVAGALALGRLLAGSGRATAAAIATTSTASATPATVATAIATAVCVGVSVGGRCLGDAAGEVAGALGGGDIEEARRLLPGLVGRDPTGLEKEDIARAVVESVAENTVDAVIAPAFWGALLGAPGALAYRAVNTLDAMVGHRNDRYRRFGWASARLDDLANWIPARLTAGLVAAVRPTAAVAIWRAARLQAPVHPSPNSGVAEAAFAAALGCHLGGVNRYGDRVERRPQLGWGPGARPGDISRAIRLSRDVSALMAALLLALPWAYRRLAPPRLAPPRFAPPRFAPPFRPPAGAGPTPP